MLQEYGLYDSLVNGHVLHTVILDEFPHNPFPSTLLDLEYAMKKYSSRGYLVYVKNNMPLDTNSPEKYMRVYTYEKAPNIEPSFRSRAYSCIACPFKQICQKIKIN